MVFQHIDNCTQGVLTALVVVLQVSLFGSCGARTGLPLTDPAPVAEHGPTKTSDSAKGSDAAAEPMLCVFDYDLTLSSHGCSELEADPEHFCRQNTCGTYGWFDQCLGQDARAAVAKCVAEHAYIGISSHASADACWQDKVLPIISQEQFPEWTHSEAYGKSSGFAYPALDDRNNWNCEDCAYTMDGSVSKSQGIGRIMRHYGMDPTKSADQARVIFWDDTPENITDVNTNLPKVRAIVVPRFGTGGADGGCGITKAEIDEGWKR